MKKSRFISRFWRSKKDMKTQKSCGEFIAVSSRYNDEILNQVQDDGGVVAQDDGRCGFAPRFGFTLIELLVVVLIIGILAAIALPAYNKAITKSRNADMKQAVRAIAAAQKVYFLTEGKYAANFSDLDVDLTNLTPLQTTAGGPRGDCSVQVRGTDSIRQNRDYYIALNATNDKLSEIGVVAYWRRGKYKCAGFGVWWRNPKTGEERLHCRECKGSLYTAGEGDFCEKVEHGTLFGGESFWRHYSLP